MIKLLGDDAHGFVVSLRFPFGISKSDSHYKIQGLSSPRLDPIRVRVVVSGAPQHCFARLTYTLGRPEAIGQDVEDELAGNLWARHLDLTGGNPFDKQEPKTLGSMGEALCRRLAA
jgi:hypothetical protein